MNVSPQSTAMKCFVHNPEVMVLEHGQVAPIVVRLHSPSKLNLNNNYYEYTSYSFTNSPRKTLKEVDYIFLSIYVF